MYYFNLYINAYKGLSKTVWFLSFILFINRCGAMVLLFTSLYMTTTLQFSLANAGFVMSCYGIGSLFGSYIGGWLSDRFNIKIIMFTSLIISGFLLLSILIIKTPIPFAILMFCYALIADLFRPANSIAISNNSTLENRTRSFSLVRLAINLGFTVSPALGGFFASRIGYQNLFLIDSFTSIIAGIVLIYFYKHKHVKLLKEKNNQIQKSNSLSAYQDKQYLIFIFLVALYGICFFQIFASIPNYFKIIYKYNTKTIGWILALNAFLIVIIEMPLINFLEKYKHQFNYIFIGVLLVSLSYLILICSNGLIIYSILFILAITLSEIFTMPFMMSYTVTKPHIERRGQYSALYSMAYAISNICAPLIGLGISQKFGFKNAYLIIILISIICAIGFKIILKKNKEIPLASKKI